MLRCLVILGMSACILATGNDNSTPDVDAFVDPLREQRKSFAQDADVRRFETALQRMITEARPEPATLEAILKGARRFLNDNDFERLPEKSGPDVMLLLEEMFFFSLNFPKNDSEIHVICEHIDRAYVRAWAIGESTLRHAGLSNFAPYLKLTLNHEQEQLKQAASNRFSPYFARAVPFAVMRRCVNDYRRKLSEQATKAQHQHFRTLRQERIALIQTPVAELTQALREAHGEPPLPAVAFESEGRRDSERRLAKEGPSREEAEAVFLEAMERLLRCQRKYQ